MYDSIIEFSFGDKRETVLFPQNDRPSQKITPHPPTLFIEGTEVKRFILRI